MNAGILYGMCWEDHELFSRLVHENDQVLTVCSAGDIALSTLIQNPASVVAVDTNNDQIELCKAKIWAFQHLEYQDAHRFIGTFGKQSDRERWFAQIGKSMDANMKQWSLSNRLDQKPLIQSGRFERYLRFFARFLLPLAVSKYTIEAFLKATTLEEQMRLYEQEIDNARYRFLFRQFFGRLQRYGRHPDLLKHVKEDLAGVFYHRIKHAWVEVPIRDNYFFRFILQGRMQSDLRLPIWARPEHFKAIRERSDTISFEHQSIVDYLETTQETFDAINLSNISEVMCAEESTHLFDLCRAKINPGGRLMVWNNMVERRPQHQWKLQEEISREFWSHRTGSLYGFLGVYQPV